MVRLEDWDVEIVRKETREFDRRFFEAKEINVDKNAINKSNDLIVL